MSAFHFSFPALAIQFLLQLDDLVSKLFDFLLVDVREIVDMGVVELFNGFGKFCIYADEFLQ